MKISAIISEYNPLHKGHLYHIKRTREVTNADFVICVMSGNFVQRGIPSIIDKWNKAKLAVENGVDLVIELPAIYSLSSAEFFAYGAVSLLNQLGVVDNICFGSESGDIDNILEVARYFSFEDDNFKDSLKSNLKKGLSYPESRERAFRFNNTNSNLKYPSLSLSASNNILGVEYCKSLIKLNSLIKPYTIKRVGGDYNEESLNSNFTSATSIRKYIKGNSNLEIIKNYLPCSTFEMLNKLNEDGYPFTFIDNIYPLIKYKMFNCEGSIEKLPDVSEGIENRIMKGMENSASFDELIKYVKSKRYTYTRINRILCQYFIGFEAFDSGEMRKNICPYARILALNINGAKILKTIKKISNFPVYTKLPKQIDRYLELDIKSTKAYSLLNNAVRANSDYTTSPYVQK